MNDIKKFKTRNKSIYSKNSLFPKNFIKSNKINNATIKFHNINKQIKYILLQTKY